LKYTVDVNGDRRTVTVDAEGVLIDGERVTAELEELENTPMSILRLGDTVHSVRVRRYGSRGRYSLWIEGHRYEVEALDERTRAIRDLQLARDVHVGPKPLVAPMPGLVVRVLVREGDTVHAGQGLVVVEAMKMENELRATVAGRVARVSVTAGTPVEKGALLVELHSETD
jgi:biotin carboxyl carrier protein